MRTNFLLSLFLFMLPFCVFTQSSGVDTRIDQMRYWMRLAAEGKVPYNLPLPEAKATLRQNIETPWGQLSPDIRLGDKKSTQSENSITVLPGERNQFLSSNNSSDQPVTWLFGSDAFVSNDGGGSWKGKTEGAGGDNNGDPAVDCDLEGRMFSGRIAKNRGQSVAWSDDRGHTWHAVQVASPVYSSDIFDKNHLCVDRCPSSPFAGRVYVAWSYFGQGSDDGHVFISYSADHGLSWSEPAKISTALSGIFLNHGVNLRTGPEGNIYAVWSIYDNWPGDESGIAFARSTDGGVTFESAKRIGPVIRGNRYTLSPKQMRLNAFPVLAVDCSDGPYNGIMTVVWSNKGIPGENIGSNSDIWSMRSLDGGETWTTPLQISQNNAPAPHTSYFPWICCDEATGNQYVVYYDDRNTDTLSCETWVAASFDGGASWMEFPVSDVAFTPQPIVGMAASYFGDYIGITSLGDYVCPVWTDNRDGIAASWCSPFRAVPPGRITDVTIRRWWLEEQKGSFGSGKLHAADTSVLSVVLVNTGQVPIGNCAVRLTTDSPFLTPVESVNISGLIQPGDSLEVDSIALLYTLAEAPEDAVAACMLSLLADDTIQLQALYLRIAAPDLLLVQASLMEESIFTNGTPDPGETFQLWFTVINQGSIPFPSGEAVFSAEHTGVHFLSESLSVGQINPGDSVVLVTTCQWPADVVTGQHVRILVSMTGQPFARQLANIQTTSALMEDWESATTTGLPWSITTDQPWSLDSITSHSGRYSLRSASPPDNGRSVLSLSYFVAKPDTVSFWIKTESEQQYDELTFRIGNTDMGSWSGRTEWQQVAFPVDSGYRTFTWIYSKDIFNGLWRDCAWLDDILLPGMARAWLSLNDTVMCNSDSAIILEALGGYFNRLRWFTLGDGAFSHSQGLSVLYEPGVADIAIGRVSLYCKTIGNLSLVCDTMALFIQRPPMKALISVDPVAYCPNETNLITLKASPLPFHHINWYTTNEMYPVAQGFNTSVAAPEESAIISAVMENTCGLSDTASIAITAFPLPRPCLGSDTSICRGASILLDPGEEFSSYLWNTGDESPKAMIWYNQLLNDAITVSVSVENEFGCNAADSVVISLSDCYTNDFSRFLIIPEHLSGILLIRCNGCISQAGGQLEVYNSKGQQCLVHSLDGMTGISTAVPFNSEASGIYLFKMTDAKGNTITGKFFW